jgi:hypothetical protein
MSDKLPWTGRVVSVQLRIRLTRSFDEQSHSYLGYCLVIDGMIGGEEGEFSVGIGQTAQAAHQFQSVTRLAVRRFQSRTRAWSR